MEIPQSIELKTVFDSLNAIHFDAFLDLPTLRWNSRLRTSAGRFIPGSRKYWKQYPPVIEVATYLLEEASGPELVRDTVAHEMIHYWLWIMRRPYGHTPEFLSKMKQMGVSRYNPVPRRRPFRYLYRCLGCHREFPTRKKIENLACVRCCRQHSNGKYDARFRLFLERVLTPGESSQPAYQTV